MTFTLIVYAPFPGRSVISREVCTNKFRKSLKVEVLLKIQTIHWARKLRTSDLVLWKLLLVRYCFVMWVLFSIFSIFFYYIINSLSPNIQKQILPTDLYTFP